MCVDVARLGRCDGAIMCDWDIIKRTVFVPIRSVFIGSL